MEGTSFIFWNWMVAVDLFAAGLSAGAFAVAVLVYFIGGDRYQDITKIGAYIAPWPLLLGLTLLIFDLERPHLFWKLLVSFHSTSVMSLGAWLLFLFSIISFVNLYLWLPERFDGILAIQRLFKADAFLAALRRGNLNKLRGWVGLVGIPVALLVGIYTGVLLGALVARPFWNNPMLPMLFLVSALNTGAASICLVGCAIKGFRGMSREKIETNKFMIHSIDFWLMLLAMVAILLFLFGLRTSPRSSTEAFGLIMGGEFTFLFWGLFVTLGVLVPLALEVYELLPHYIRQVPMREHNPWISGALTLSILVGGFFLRYLVVYAGQVAFIATL